MEARKERNEWRSVPQFGGWDHKGQKATDYSMVFQRARVNRKQIKKDTKPESVMIETEPVAREQEHERDQSPSKRKKILTYLNCCIKP